MKDLVVVGVRTGRGRPRPRADCFPST